MSMFRSRGWQPSGHANGRIGREDALSTLGDFTTTWRVLLLSCLASGIGVLSAFVALALLKLIGLFTNLFFFQRWDTTLVSPAGHTLGLFVVLVPIVGALIIGLMARYGSERIRGHGIPEAIEAILINGSRVEPRVAFLKPLSAAISIGSGGPFGAEGPIIMTGGAFGSLIAQFFRLTRRGGLAGCRTAALRVETPEPDSCRPGERCGRRRASLYHWVGPALPSAPASRLYWP